MSQVWFEAGSKLIGASINSLTHKLQRVGSPTGNIEFGVFEPNANLKVSFDSFSIATLPSAMTDMEFTIRLCAVNEKICHNMTRIDPKDLSH